MKITKNGIKRLLKKNIDIYCLSLSQYLLYLDIAIKMPVGSVKARIKKAYK